MYKYVIHPGRVRSTNDKEWHWISAPVLMDLYGVRAAECVVIDPLLPASVYSGYGDLTGLIHLYPSFTGNYQLPRRP